MPTSSEGAYLAHISDTVTAIDEKLGEQVELQQNVQVVLNQLLATNEAQSEMLADILAAASEEAGPSPMAQALEALFAKIQQMDDNQMRLMAFVAELPEAVGQQIAASFARGQTSEAARV